MRYLFPLSPWNAQRQFQKPVWVYPWLLASYATYLRNQGHEIEWDKNLFEFENYSKIELENEFDAKLIQSDQDIDVSFLKLPIPDRVFTDAKNPRWQKYGNYKYHPATHMLSALGCTHGKCSFCYERGKNLIIRPVDHVIREIETLVKEGYKEVFDDSATLPDGRWRSDFVKSLNKFSSRIRFSCNLRIQYDDFISMRSSGFRMVLVGVESANQKTLDKINKGIRVENIIPVLKKMSDAGLEPHITAMFGYPFETNEEAMNTVKLVHYLLKKGYAKTAQASVFSPPRTLPDPNSVGHKYVKMVYEIYKSPEFWWRKISSIREWADIRYLLRSGRLVLTEKYKPSGK